METLVIQTGVQHGRIAEIARSRDGLFTIGRGFDNDMVLTDPHIAPQQLKFQRENDHWKLIILDDTNPVMLNGVAVAVNSIDVKSGDRVTVGRVKLALFAEDHPVAATRKLRLLNLLSGKPSNPFIPVVVLLLAALLDYCVVFFEKSTNLKWEDPAMAVLTSALFTVVWAGIWAVTGRIARHQHQFGTQVIVTALVSIFSTLLMTATDYLVYPFHSAAAQEIAGWLVAFITLALLLRFNLMIATNLQRPAGVAALVAGLTIAVVFGLSYLGKNEFDRFEPVYSSSIKPPILGIFDGVAPDDYFMDLAETVKDLENELLQLKEPLDEESGELP